MPTPLTIPAVGESITEVQISQWLKNEGDSIAKDEPVVVIDSEKTTLELPAPAAGKLAKILQPAGQVVKVGQAIAELETDGAGVAAGSRGSETKGKRKEPAAPSRKPPATAVSAPAAKSDSAKTSSTDHRVEAPPAPKTSPEPSPAATAPPPTPAPENVNEAAAAEMSARRPEPVEKAKTQTRDDEKEEKVVPMSMLRRTIARRLVEAQQTAAMLTTFNEVDMSAVQALRHRHQEDFQKRHGTKLGLMSFFVKATVEALKQFPQLNAEVRDDSIVFRNYFDIGVAIASERGLVVPVLRHAERRSFAGIELEIAGWAARAKDNTLKPEDLAGGTFTITNGGVFGSLFSTPMLNPPQSGILGLHTIAERPVAREGAVVIRPMMYVALTYDHRIVDGREAVLFLRRIKDAIEEPVRMLVEV